MKYSRLGNSGLNVSQICLGCMSFGDVAVNWFHKWVLNEEDSREIIKKSLELGINFFDTANVYSKGTSEEFLGKALKDMAKRDEVVIATKARGKMGEHPNGEGLSRKHLTHQLDESLKRLQTDYIDLYIIHRWDPNTPIEETIDTLDNFVRQGKVRYIGASSMWAWQLQKALVYSERYNLAKFISMQNHYNLIYREEEREMHPLCREYGVGLTPWAPLAAGKLARTGETARKEQDQMAKIRYTDESDGAIIQRVAEVAEKLGATRGQVAVAWMLNKGIESSIIGATKLAQLEDLVKSTDLILSSEDIAYLEEPYLPHAIVGHS